jgi:general secretion pathway protein D
MDMLLTIRFRFITAILLGSIWAASAVIPQTIWAQDDPDVPLNPEVFEESRLPEMPPESDEAFEEPDMLAEETPDFLREYPEDEIPRAGSTPQSPPGEGKVALSNGQRLVSIDFSNVDIGIFIKFISDLTKKNFVIDERVKARVSIISPGKITVAEAYTVFESVLEVHGYAAVPAGEITKIVPAPEARTKNIKTRLQEESGVAGDMIVTQIIPMRYADTEEIKRLFTPLVSKSAVILSYPPTNTLIITDVQSNINRLMNILRAIDITGVGQQIALIPVENANAGKLVTLLNAVFKSTPRPGRPAPEKGITFVADDRTNIIVVMASEGDTENIRELIKSLDKETPRGQGRIHVYYLEHASAEELAKVLQDISQQRGGAVQADGKPTAPVVSDQVRITADKATNSLIIMAEMEEYLTIEDIIRKIDIPRAMVYIEALIMEVNVNKDFRLGTEWLLGSETSYQGKDGIYGGGFGGGAIGGDPGYQNIAPIDPSSGRRLPVPLPPGFSLGIFGEALSISGVSFPSISAVVQAYKKDRDARILSTPQILTTDNQEAKIYVGRNVPFQTTATATQAGSEVFNSFEYRDVGKTLKITPMISKDRMVRLNLALEVTELESTSEFRPTTLKRTVETTAIVRDQQTIVLGGLIDDTASSTNYRVPCLGDIPGLGLAFRSKATAGAKTNLYVFLTPRVIQNPIEAEAVADQKRGQIDALRGQDIKLYNKRRDAAPDVPETITPQSKIESHTYREEKTPPAPANMPVQDSAPAAAAAPISGNLSPVKEPPAPMPPQPTKVHIEENTLPPEAPQQPAVIPATVQKPSESSPAVPAAKPTQTAGAQKTSTGKKTLSQGNGYTIQVASLQTVEAANQLLRELTALGYAAYTVRTESTGKIWYRLRVGYYEQQESAEEVIAQLRTNRYNPILLKL